MGFLIAFEGIDGCGKTTQIRLLHKWLTDLGYEVIISKWFSGKLAAPILAELNKSNYADSIVGSHIIATDFAWRVESVILPALQAGKVVICDRYLYTALSRHVVRGLSEEYVRRLYPMVPTPDITFYFQLDPVSACERKGQEGLGFFESGLDMYAGKSIPQALEEYEHKLFTQEELRAGFLRFQGQVKERYESLAEYRDFCVVDASRGIQEIFALIQNRCLTEMAVEKKAAI